MLLNTKYIIDLNKYDFWTNKKIIFFDSFYVYSETYSYFVLYYERLLLDLDNNFPRLLDIVEHD